MSVKKNVPEFEWEKGAVKTWIKSKKGAQEDYRICQKVERNGINDEYRFSDTEVLLDSKPEERLEVLLAMVEQCKELVKMNRNIIPF